MAANAYPFSPANTRFGFGAMDIVVNMYTPEIIRRGPRSHRREFPGQGEGRAGPSARPDARAIHREDGPRRDRALLPGGGALRRSACARLDGNSLREGACCRAALSAPLLRARRHRPNARNRRAERARHAVKEFGFVGAHLYPHWFGQGAGRRDLLSVLRALRRARHPDHDAGRPLPGVSERPAAAVQWGGRSRSTGWRSTFPN